ncbi:MAG TPA: hypothetical protein VLN45_02840, partial [Ignavibacteriaceae bacterium]|nr:hypothetical protein [Ignavibacteriaceae bacterium]
MFRKLSLLIGFTQTEIKILLFIIAAFLVGFGYKTFFLQDENNTLKEFDYSREDSLFYSTEEDFKTDSANAKENSVDYKQEVLDFKPHNFSEG